MKVWLKGVLVGGVVDVVSSPLMSIPLAVYALSNVEVAHTPRVARTLFCGDRRN